MHMLSKIIYDYCTISLFAEMVLHIGQVPMLVSIYIKLKSCSSVCHAVNSPGTINIAISTA